MATVRAVPLALTDCRVVPDLAAVTALTCLLSLSCFLWGRPFIRVCSAGPGHGSGETERYKAPPFCSLAPRNSAVCTGGGRHAPPHWPRRPVWRVWDTEREGLDPASSNGSVQEWAFLEGHLSCVLMDLRITGQWRVTTWGLRWAASSAWQVLRQQVPGETDQGRAEQEHGCDGSPAGLVGWCGRSSLGVPVEGSEPRSVQGWGEGSRT